LIQGRTAVAQKPKYSSPKAFLLIFRLEIMALLACLTAAAFSAAGVLNDTVAPWIYTLAAALGEGILLGAAARLLLRGFSFAMRWTAALTAAFFSLVMTGWLTRGLIGADLSFPIRHQHPDWGGLVQLLAGGVIATFVLIAFRKRAPKPAPEVELVKPSVQEPRPAELKPKKNKAGSPVRESRPVRERIRSALRFFRRNNRDAEIRLVGKEEHKCPYCLQPIEARDPRGVVMCPVCRTRHHKDCWDITGMCQVPHYHD
jgi:ribosomal protein L37AE/L43A